MNKTSGLFFEAQKVNNQLCVRGADDHREAGGDSNNEIRTLTIGLFSLCRRRHGGGFIEHRPVEHSASSSVTASEDNYNAAI